MVSIVTSLQKYRLWAIFKKKLKSCLEYYCNSQTAYFHLQLTAHYAAAGIQTQVSRVAPTHDLLKDAWATAQQQKKVGNTGSAIYGPTCKCKYGRIIRPFTRCLFIYVRVTFSSFPINFPSFFSLLRVNHDLGVNGRVANERDKVLPELVTHSLQLNSSSSERSSFSRHQEKKSSFSFQRYISRERIFNKKLLGMKDAPL